MVVLQTFKILVEHSGIFIVSKVLIASFQRNLSERKEEIPDKKPQNKN